MRIGIIVHSKTGITLGFGECIASKLRESGYTVDMVQLKTDVPVNAGSVRSAPKFTIVNMPDCKQFDALLVGGPVWALSASPVIFACIKALRDISGKKVLPFVTMGFPFASMGGKQAIAVMSSALAKAGATALPGIIIPHLFRDHNRLMEEAVSTIPSHFEQDKQ